MGTAEELFANPKHPYTVSLFPAALGSRRLECKYRILLRGDPQAHRTEHGCPVDFDREVCLATAAKLLPVEDSNQVAACHFAGELASSSASAQHNNFRPEFDTVGDK